MKKYVKIAIIAVACICVICGGFYFFSQSKDPGKQELATEVEKILLKDLDKNYPKTPREVMKLYNRIVECYHATDTTDQQVGELVDQMVRLFDEELLAKTTRDEYYASVVTDIDLYKKDNKVISSISVCDSNDVEYKTDDRNGDKIAFVDVSYFFSEDGKFSKSYIRFGLREDENGNWKILGMTLTEGESSEDDK